MSIQFTVRVVDLETLLPVTNAIVYTIFEHQNDPWANKPGIVDRQKDPDVERGALCDITFSNPHDGIQKYVQPEKLRSSYIFPHEVPTNDYVSAIYREGWYSDEYGTHNVTNAKEDKDINHIFRVPTVLDKDGNIVQANYGRIKGEIRISSNGRVYFQYWFNPNPKSRSLESEKQPY